MCRAAEMKITSIFVIPGCAEEPLGRINEVINSIGPQTSSLKVLTGEHVVCKEEDSPESETESEEQRKELACTRQASHTHAQVLRPS